MSSSSEHRFEIDGGKEVLVSVDVSGRVIVKGTSKVTIVTPIISVAGEIKISNELSGGGYQEGVIIQTHEGNDGKLSVSFHTQHSHNRAHSLEKKITPHPVLIIEPVSGDNPALSFSIQVTPSQPDNVRTHIVNVPLEMKG